MSRERASCGNVKAGMRGLAILSAILLAAPAFAAETPVRVVEEVPAAKVQVVKAVAKRETGPEIRMNTVVRCEGGACASMSRKTATSSTLIREDGK